MHPSSLSRRKFLALSSATAAASLFARFGAAACPVVEDTDAGKKLTDAINTFAGDLFGRLNREEKGSLFFSPFSIETALAMTAAGARGETFTEMEKTLHLPDEPHAAFGNLIDHLNSTGRDRLRGYELSVVNAIWAQKGFPWNKEFAELTQKHYGTGLVEADFSDSEAARKRINEWVEKQTKERIKDLIGRGIITPLTRMVLTNAIYFKSAWLFPFEKSVTKDAAFTRADGTKADVPLMHQSRTLNYGTMHRGSRSGLTVQVLELPYKGNELSMLVYLPDQADGANRLLLTQEEIRAPKLERCEVKVWLPRFKTESEFLLNVPLIDMGMKRAFGKADFTGLSPEGKRLFISAVLHKTFVDVNEDGTEAAAATGVVIAEASAPREMATFRADRPFVYVIRDNKTGTALFMGRYSGPAK